MTPRKTESSPDRPPGQRRSPARALVSLLVLALSVLPLSGEPARGAAPIAEAGGLLAPGPPAVSEAHLRAHVEYLASDRLGGRLVGTEGIRLAEAYIAGKFRDYGLTPVPGRRGWFLDFTLYRVGFDPQETKLEGSASGQRFQAQLGADFRPMDESGAGRAAGEVVFAGYGITAPEYGYDDYQGLDVKGRIVLVLRHEPNENDPASPFNGAAFTNHAMFGGKVKNAARHGAAGLLMVTDPLHHPEADDLRLTPVLRLEPANPPQTGQPGFPAAQVSRALAERLLGGLPGTGGRLAELQSAVDGGSRPVDLAPPAARAELTVRILSASAKVAARDVVGFLPGSDPRLADEWIVVGAHHDHLGSFKGTGDTIYNGADDNASGTAAVLELARLFAAAKPRSARSMLFVTYSAEEEGLLGSRAIVADRLLPLGQVSFALNLDMIGRNPAAPIAVYGDETARPLRELIGEANRGLDLPLQLYGPRIIEDSDHATYQGQGIPFLAFFTGLHRDYHQVSDEAGRLDYARMGRIVALSDRILARLANGREPLRPLHQVAWLGLQFEVQGRGPGSPAVVTGVMEGSPAAAEGIRPGDVLLAVGGQPVDGTRPAGEPFAAVKAGTATTLVVGRGSARLEVPVSRPLPGFLGILPRPAEPGPGVLVDTVVAGGPAEKAGLQKGDIIVAVAGRPMGIDTLDSLMAQLGAGNEVSLAVRRDGAALTLPITLGQRPGAR